MLDRRSFWTLGLIGIAGSLICRPAGAASPNEGAMSHRTAFGFSFDALGGARLQLADYAGRPMLVVNTASLCGFTPQYAGLQELWTRYGDAGLTVIGVPSNDFGSQEPGGVKDIEETAHHQYGVTFPITAKTAVKGPNAHPFYKWAAGERPHDVPRWNFHKYLIGRDGYIADVFASEIEPTDTRVVTAIARQINGAAQQRLGTSNPPHQ
jgi:glutathione peroxidase